VVGVGAALALVLASPAIAQTQLTDPGATDTDEFGASVAVSGTELVVGAPQTATSTGVAYAFGYSDGEWTQQAKETPGSGVVDQYGYSVAISGSTMVVGAWELNSETGAAYVYTLADGSWTYQTTLTASDAASQAEFGYSVAISGSTIVVGAPGTRGLDSPGEAYVFTGSGSSWTQASPLEPTGGASDDGFGSGVATSGSTVVIGDPNSGGEVGSAYVYTGSGTTWTYQTTLTASGSEFFGWSVAIGGSTLAVGGYGRDSDEGSAYIFTGSGSSWSTPTVLDGSFGGQNFGYAVAVSEDGSQVVVGAPDYVGETTSTPGAAYVYSSSGALTQTLAPTDDDNGDAFGWSVGISGDSEVVGAFNYDSGEGEAYVFGSPSPTPTATTTAANIVTSTTATLGGTVNPNGQSTSADFEYGTTTAYGTTTSVQSLGDGTSSQPVTAQLTGLAPGTTYHFQLVATANSTNYDGGDETFTTAPACPTTSMTIDTVEVLASCISQQSGGTYLATGDTRFGNGASVVDAGTQTPAALVLNPAAHTISIAAARGGGAQSGELEADGVDVATGDLVIATQGVTDPVSGIGGSAGVSGFSSVDLSLSGWTFSSAAIASTVYLAPSSAGGGAIVDGQLTLPAWLGDALKFGSLAATGLVPGVSGQLAVQAGSSGQLSVINGGVSFKATVLGDSNLQLANAELSYERAGDEWTGTAELGFASLVKLSVNGVISDGKLDDLGVNFACATSKICGSRSSLPTIGAILDLKDVDLNMINLQGIDYTPPTLGPGGFPILRPACVPTKLFKCPAPQPAPQVDGAVIVGLLGDRVIAGGDFDYLLDGQFTASGGVGLAPLYGSKFSDPPPLVPGQSATNVVDNLLSSGFAGVELAGASIDYTPPGLLQATGTVFLPPPPFPFQFLKGTISIGIDSSHFTGEGSLDLVIPKYVPVIGGDTFGGVQALISDEAAAAEASLPQYCVSVDVGFHTYTACSPKITFLAAFDWATGKVTVDLNGGNINDYATVPQASASAAVAGNSRFVHVPARRQLASFTIHSRRGTPDVELISPAGRGTRRVLRLATSKKRHNHSGALAWVDRKAHTEGFLVLVPQGGSWTVKRLKGPRIVSVKVMVPRHTIHKTTYPHAVERASDLPNGKVSSDKQLTLHYSVPSAGPGTTVELWAGTGPHGAGGVMIADGLPPAGTATWKLSGLPSGRYWPYAIVDENGIPVSIQYWPGSVEIVNAAAPSAPTGVGTALSSGQAYVYWNEVGSAATYAITATPSGGGALVRDAVPASQLAAQLALPAGTWSIAVQAVNAQEQASLPSAAGTLTVP
jgi:hypothetical protein